jgi:CHAT domain-containing protein
VEQIAFSDIQSVMDERVAAIEWYVIEDKILTFILTAKSLYPLVEQAYAEKLEALGNWGNDYLAAYAEKEKKQWKADLAANLKKLAEILNIDRLLSRVEDIFDKQGEKCDRLVLIPHRFLHLFPLHALPLANGDLLMDRFPRGLSYAPSIQLLQLSKTWKRPSLERFFSVNNPTEDLGFADLEVATIRSYFHPHDRVLTKQEASKTALASEPLNETNVAHFSCHGYFDFETPSQSALLLAGATASGDETDGGAINIEKCLTLGDIFALDLRQCRIATLSACETGLTDFNSLGDEYIGLPSGFLYAGSPSVVSSLWVADDISTAFLIIKFYQNLESTRSVAVALNQAQLWLRDITKVELKAWITANRLPLDPTMRQKLTKRLHKWQDNQKPFQNPFYWAAFCAIGQ